jgi:hypothetical protein
VLQTITTEFIERFKALNNMVADVYIKHILYGAQKIKKCVLHPFVGEDRIGFIINEEEVYITIEELSGVSIDSDRCIIESEVMELYINLL